MTAERDEKQLAAARDTIGQLAKLLQIDAYVRLWNGETLPLGSKARDGVCLTIDSPGVISSLLRRPTLDRLIQHYIHGQIGLEGGTLLDFGEQLTDKRTRAGLKTIPKGRVLRNALPFLFAPAVRPDEGRRYQGDETGLARKAGENRDFIKFHYDVSNEFYQLFLDPQMIYTCAYFTDWGNSLAQAQTDKLEMICRKLRLKEGDRLLDIGCGWGGLICYAVQNYGVQAYGVTLSQNQYEYGRDNIKRLGLEDRAAIELKDYADVTGEYDKIAAIGLNEHIGLSNVPAYMRKIQSLLADKGLFLNHAITRRAKRKKRRWGRMRPEKRALAKYIFPGGELDNIGHTLQEMEIHGFEVHDVEGWREHYALTCRYWCETLTARKDEAVALVGDQTYRIWVAYLAAVSLSFTRGSARLYQTLASKNARGPSALPPSRADLYE